MLPPLTASTSGIKLIYILRNGRDVAVSFYHHLSNQDDDNKYTGSSFSEFLNDFLEGKLAYGKWLLHVHDYLKLFQHSHSDNILILQYEDLVQDLKTQVLRIISFLNLSYSDEEVELVLPLMSFAAMKTNRKVSSTST